MQLESSSAAAPQNEGVFARVMDWLAGTGPSSSQAERILSSDVQEAQDFLIQRAGPDSRLVQTLQHRPVFASPEDEWRYDCLAFAELKNLDHVDQMRVFYFDPDSVGTGADTDVVVVGVGAHYKRRVATQEELLLHIVKEMEKVGTSRQYTIVYFNADAELSAIPDTIFFQQLHAALHPWHMRKLKAFYVVHPSRLLKYWIFMLRLAIPEIYGRVTYIDRLSNLYKHLEPKKLEIPQHVLDYDFSF